MSLQSIVYAACDRSGLARPTVIATGTDATSRRLFSLANEEGKALAKLNWPVLREEQTFTSTATEAQTNAMPADWNGFVDNTFWNRTAVRPLIGPISPQEWQALKAHSGSGYTDSFTYRGTSILISPTATAGQTMAFEFYSKNWCESSGGTDQSAWAADTDVGILDEELMTLGLIWRFKKASGMAWTEDYGVYEAQVRISLGKASPGGVIDMSKRAMVRQPGIFSPLQDFPAPA